MIEERRSIIFPREDEVKPNYRILTKEDVIRYHNLQSDAFLIIIIKVVFDIMIKSI